MLSQRSEKLRGELQKEEDYSGWLVEQASKLRGHSTNLDWDDIAEELEDMSIRERRELRPHLKQLLKHLLKWRFAASRRSASWNKTIRATRHAIEDLLDDSPSLKGALPDLLTKAYGRALADAADEMKLNQQQASRLLQSCPWAFEEFMNSDFWPEHAKNPQD